MNKRGHTQTLVPAQPGNRNAVKSGVYSKAALAPRVAELNAEFACYPADEVAEETLRGNLNSLLATREAMDLELAKSLVGRSGEPRTLLDHYLRLTDKIMRNAVALAAVAERRQPAIAPPAAIEVKPEEEPPEALHEAVARAHYRDTLADVSPDYFDPPMFLLCVADSDDPEVTFDNHRAASKLLTRIEKQRAERCTCRTTLTARDSIEMRDWIDMWRENRDSSGEADRYVAGLVREIAAGRTRDLYPLHSLMIDAVEAVNRDATADPETEDARRQPRVRADRRVARFWQTLLSPDPDAEPTMRLQALAALDEAGALAPCTCPKVAKTELDEERADRARAFVVRMVAQNNHHAAKVIAQFPDTALAVRDMIDETLVAAATTERQEIEE